MNWENLSEREQFDILNTSYNANAKRKLVTDIVNIPSKFQYIKGNTNKQLVVKYITQFWSYDFDLLSDLYKYAKDVDYCAAIQNLIYWNIPTKYCCSKELFEYIIRHISFILNNRNVAQFFLYFKDVLSKEIIIHIHNELSKDFTKFFYIWCESLYGIEFRQKLEFLKTLGVS